MVRGVVVLVREGCEVAAWPLVTPERLELSTVNRLATLQLRAREVGCSIRLERLCPQLAELLDLLGLRVEVGG